MGGDGPLLVGTKPVAELMGISTKTIERMNYEHKVGPIQIRVGRGCRRYVRREFIAWLESPLADGTLMGRRARPRAPRAAGDDERPSGFRCGSVRVEFTRNTSRRSTTLPGQPVTQARRVQTLWQTLAEVLHELRKATPETHFRGDPAPGATWTAMRDRWRGANASVAMATIKLARLVDALAEKANGKAPEFDTEEGVELASAILDDLEIEAPDLETSSRHRFRDELIRLVGPERIRELAAEYEGGAGEKPLRNSAFCEWAVAKVRSRPATNREGSGFAGAVSPTT